MRKSCTGFKGFVKEWFWKQCVKQNSSKLQKRNAVMQDWKRRWQGTWGLTGNGVVLIRVQRGVHKETIRELDNPKSRPSHNRIDKIHINTDGEKIAEGNLKN